MMFDGKPAIKYLSFRPDARIIVISDIHGNTDYLSGVLEAVNFSEADELVIDGDFLEKGSHCLDTLHRVMGLCETGRAHAVCGNCDGWANALHFGNKMDSHLSRYFEHKHSGLLWEMYAAEGIDPAVPFSSVRDLLADRYRAEFRFLDELPHVIETDSYTFVHSGYDPAKPLCDHRVDELTRRDRFMAEGTSFEKWVIVGHYPVVLYGRDTVCANPVIDRERRIVSIDGGCVIKDDGQLNALIIPPGGSDLFSFVSYDGFPKRRVLSGQAASDRSFYIPWGNNDVQVLSRGPEFSRVRHVGTGYEMDVLTRYLFSDGEFCGVNDCTDYVLPLKAGDEVGVVETTSRGYFVKHDGTSGWYFGELA